MNNKYFHFAEQESSTNDGLASSKHQGLKLLAVRSSLAGIAIVK